MDRYMYRRMTLRGLLNIIFGRKNIYRLRYFRQRRRFPDLNNPKDYSEWVIASILSDKFLEYADYADKIKVRDYVRSKGLDDILLEHYAYFDSTDEIRPEILPEKFALKTNRGASAKDVSLCLDKDTFDWNAAKEKLAKVMDFEYEYELHYNKITPRIICEELIEAPDGKFPIDYKFTCIKGEIADVFVCSNRESGKPCHCSVDLEWNQLPYIRDRYLPDAIPPRPKHLDRMVEIAKILSEDFDIVRVDLYEYKDKVYFSELTFSPFGGIMYGYNDTGIKEIGKLITEKFKQPKKD